MSFYNAANAGVQVKARREFEAYTGETPTGDPVKDAATIKRVSDANAAEAEVDGPISRANAGLQTRNRREFEAFTGEAPTGDPVKDAATIKRVSDANAAEAEVDHYNGRHRWVARTNRRTKGSA